MPTPGKLIDAADIRASVVKAGFTPKEITATLVGRLALLGKENKMVLKIGDGTFYVLLAGEAQLTKLTKLAQPPGPKGLLRVSGKLEQDAERGHGEHPSVLRVESFEVEP